MTAAIRQSDYHLPVLFGESLEALALRPGGTYVDMTFGGGGHSRGILEQLGPAGRLIAFDQDADALDNAPRDDRFTLVRANFRHAWRWLDYLDAPPVDGILADLGVSSFQIDTDHRGFSFMEDGPLDMRMNNAAPETAADLLARADFDDLVDVLSRFGEVRNAKTLARRLLEARDAGLTMRTTAQLADFLRPLAMGPVPRYLAQVFQALRMAVNDELGALAQMLERSVGQLAPGGRLAVITFHSLEDRMVKRFMRSGRLSGEAPRDAFGRPEVPFRVITRRPIEAGAEEVGANRRARSARLRICERIEDAA